jgi:molybdopterin synthase catalytic subunit
VSSAEMPLVIRIGPDDFDISEETRLLTMGRREIGAVASFIGLCRSEDDSLAALELEHYPGMAEAEIGRIAMEAAKRWPLQGVRVIHRVGRIAPGKQIVLVMAASRHRAAAFAGAEFIMDFLKSRAPFWKKQHGADGRDSGWVDARETDEEALKRWK